MEDNKIRYEELFDAGLKQEVLDLANTIDTLKEKLGGLRTATQTAAQAQAQQVQSMQLDNEQMQKMLASAESLSAGMKSVDTLLNMLSEDEKKLVSGMQLQTTVMATNAKATQAVAQAVADLSAKLHGNTQAQGQNSEEKKKGAGLSKQLQKLYAEELTRVQELASALKTYTDALHENGAANEDAMNAVKEKVEALDVEKMSYNEMYATYNALKTALNAMTKEQREGTQEGKLMTAQSRKLYETMNELQIATGKYTLQVGKYKSAFDGLGFSFIQILREAPSALNFNQFLLAISNNIPLFMDQAQAYINGMKKDLADLQKQEADGIELTQEQQQQLQQLLKATQGGFQNVIAVVKRLKTAIFSLQGATILFTMLIRFLPKIVGWVKDLVNKTNKWAQTLKSVRRMMKEVEGAAETALVKTRSEIELIMNDLQSTTQGTVEWQRAVARLNELMGTSLSLTQANKEAVREATEAYLEQQRQIAINNKIVELYAANAMKMYAREHVYEGLFSGSETAKMLGFEGEQAEQFAKDYEEYRKDLRRDEERLAQMEEMLVERKYMAPKYMVDSYGNKTYGGLQEMAFTTAAAQAVSGMSVRQISELSNDEIRAMCGGDNVAMQQILDARNYYKGLNKKETDKNGGFLGMGHSSRGKVKRDVGGVKDDTDAIMRMYNELYKAMPSAKTTSGGRRGGGVPSFEDNYTGPSWAEVMRTEAEAMDEWGADEYEVVKKWLAKRQAMVTATYAAEQEAAERDRAEKLKTLNRTVEDAMVFVNGFERAQAKLEQDISAAGSSDDEAKARRAKLQRQYADAQAIIRNAGAERNKIERVYRAQMTASQNKYTEDYVKAEEEAQEKLTKIITENAKTRTKEVMRTAAQSTSAAEVDASIEKIQEEIHGLEYLRDAETQSAESAKMYEEAIASLTADMEKLEYTSDKLVMDTIQLEYRQRLLDKTVRRRVVTVRQEAMRNTQLTERIKVLRDEIQALDVRYKSAKGSEEYKKRVLQLREEIKKLQGQMSDSKLVKGVSLYDTIFEGIADATEGRDVERTMAGVLGKDRMAELGEAYKGDAEGLTQYLEGLYGEMLETQKEAVKSWYNTTYGYVKDLAQAYVDLAEAKVAAAEKETEAAQEAYDKEKALLEAGYASRVEATWAELQERKKAQKQAEEDAKKAAAVQQDLANAEAAADLVAAVAKLYKSFAGVPGGIALATVMSGAMVAAFLAAKSKAKEAVQYGEGTVEMIGGGSHASGHDSSLAYDSKGRERRVEGGEMFAVFNKRAVRRIGAGTIADMVNGVNRGRIESGALRMMRMEAGATDLQRVTAGGSAVSLRTLEHGVGEMVRQGSSRRYTDGKGRTVIERRNGKTVILN